MVEKSLDLHYSDQYHSPAMARHAPLVCQHLENISRQALEKQRRSRPQARTAALRSSPNTPPPP